jgi:hypothetical protein
MRTRRSCCRASARKIDRTIVVDGLDEAESDAAPGSRGFDRSPPARAGWAGGFCRHPVGARVRRRMF